MTNSYTALLGKAVQKIARLRGGGSALPGLFVEKIDPNFVPRTLATLPLGVVVVSGTNGKTTTTKMVVELLEGQGLRVFTNRTGSNFVRGVAAALLSDVDRSGKLYADIAVLELDEAHAVHFVKAVQPRFSLLLNVMRDQLDRFGEIDTTAKMLQHIAESTSQTVVINREDPRLARLGALYADKTVYFGLSSDLQALFPNDDTMRSGGTVGGKQPPADVVLQKIEDEQTASFTMGKETLTATLELRGVYNIFNAAAALALVRQIIGDTIDNDKLKTSLSHITPAFGRGESLTVGGHTLELVLVKNPSGFRLSLSSFNPEGYATMITINDNYADGRDMSWLWDVDFDSLKTEGVAKVAGIRAFDMALRLQYDEVAVGDVTPYLPDALRSFIEQNPHRPKRIYCTYTAMLALRRELAKITNVETIS